MRTVVELEDVSVSFGREKVLEGISLRVEEGDFLGLLGPNGAGKTTLLKVVLGLIPIDGGRVKVLGEDVRQGTSSRRNAIGYVPQRTPAQIQGLPATVFEVVSTGLASKGNLFRRIKDAEAKRLEEALELVGLNELKQKKISELSGGQVQRALIARSLVGDPIILILDEPTSHIDITSQSSLFSLLERLNRDRAMTVILSSHDISAVSRLSTQVACVNKKLFFHGDPRDFTSDKFSEAYGYPIKLVSHERHS